MNSLIRPFPTPNQRAIPSTDDTGTSALMFDRTTGFPTRALLVDRMKIALAAARRYRRRAALLHIGLDRLEFLLQSLAQEAAEAVQASIAEALGNCVRDCDTVARLGTAEFVVLLPEIGQREDAGILAARVVEAVARLFERNEPRFPVSASIGVAVYPTDGTSQERLLKGAAAALRTARGTEGGGFALADATSAELKAIKPLEFLSKYCIGVSEIDAEHRDLVARMNALANDLQSGIDPRSLEGDVRAMVELLRAHLTTEGILLGTSPFEASVDRKTRDLRFLEDMNCILLHVNSQSIALAIRHLYDWLIPHLLYLDRKMVS